MARPGLARTGWTALPGAALRLVCGG